MSPARHRLDTSPARAVAARKAVTTTGSLVAVAAAGVGLASPAAAQAPRVVPSVAPASAPAPAAPASTSTPVPSTALPTQRTVLVKRGDTVSALAAKHGVSTTAMLAANNITGRTVIFPGQTLVVPDANASLPPAVTAPSTSSTAASGTAAAVLATARAQIGTPYAWSEETPSRGFDCSGLTYYVYGQNGISLPRSTSGLRSAGRAVSASEAQPGDLVLFSYAHVAIYAGNGMIIDSPHTGATVTERALWTDNVSYRRVL